MDSVLFQKFAEKQGTDIYIIPTSLYELILIPKKDNACHEYLQNILMEVNRKMLYGEDVLSEHVYLYQRSAYKFV